MGGHAAGEVASRIAVEVIESFINDTREADLNRTWPFPYDTAISLDGNRLKGSFRLANRRLGAAMAADESLRGMATTAAAVLMTPRAFVVAHVGDSRVYLWRDGHLKQLTQDHSWVSEQVRAGMLSAADARRHPWRNVVTRAIAGGDDPDVELKEFTLAVGDRVLLCSDGLSAVVPHEVLDPGRDEHAQVVLTGQLEDECVPVGRSAEPEVVQYDAGGAERDVPVVGLVQVVVQTDDRARLAVAAVALDHLPALREPLAPVGLDEDAALVAVDRRLHDVDAGDDVGLHGAQCDPPQCEPADGL